MNLKEIRKSKGLTQLEASKLVSIPLRTYKRIEKECDESNFKYVNALNILKNYVFTSNKTKIELIRYADNIITINEQREVFNLAPIEGGVIFIFTDLHI